MKFACVVFLTVVASSLANQCSNRRSNSKLLCYYSEVTDINTCMCTHIILPANSDARTIDSVRQQFKGGHVLLTANEFNEDLVNVLKNNKIDGLEVNLKKLDDKNDVPDFISTVKSKLGSDLFFAVALPSRAEILAKYYNLKALTKHADLFILQTAFLGASQNVTFHPSRLSGLWDMQNTDSVVDLVVGMGAPLSKLVISAPVQAFQFTLQDEGHTAPGSPALEVKSLTRDQLCNKMSRGFNWTLERDQDQAGPYIFRKKSWIAFDDATSMDIKAKYTRVRGLAGLALKDLSQDGGENCGGTLLKAAHTGLSRQSRAPRGAVLQSLEREILDTPARPLDTIQLSPYRISRVIDVEGNVHSIRQDTRTEFECARQGYFVHPRSCGRFFRCVKFDQLADDFSVFEFDCPAGLSFDSRYEVCVWPGSLPYSSPCSGSSEIAPVPRTRFVCPQVEGYYADPENCRWFFACLDHGKSPMSAYEFRCPFGLVFDESRLVCEWPWLVPKCGSGGAVGFEYDNQISVNGARLETYDGLGALGVVGLGGLSGTLVQPQPKVYTSVVSGGIGLHGHAEVINNLGFTQNHAGIGFNQGAFGSTQTGNGAGIGLVNVAKVVGSGGSSLSSGDAYSGAVFNQHNEAGLLKNQGVIGGTQGASYQANIDYGQQAYNVHDTSDYTNNGRQSNSVHLVGSNLIGNKATQTASFINHGLTQQQLTSSAVDNQLHQKSVGAVYNNNNVQGTVIPVVPIEKIHIVGGFSAVGTGGKSAAELAGNNLNVNDIASVTPASPLSKFSIVLPSPITPVAAAPVPVVKSDSEAYEGGVVANVPELQYKIVAPSASNVYFESSFKDDYALSRGLFGFGNLSQNANVNYISSTPIPLALSTVSYEYNSPFGSLAQGSTVKPFVTIDQTRADYRGYYYPKPAIGFAEEPVRAVTPSTITSFSYTKHSSGDTVHALNVSPKSTQILQPVNPAAVSRFSINSAEKSIIATQPIVSVTPVVPIIQHKIVSVTPTVPIVQQKIQPAVVSSYNFQNLAKNEGYQYSQPVVSVKAVQPVITPKIHSIQPAVVSSYNFQNSFASNQANAVYGEKLLPSVQPAATLHGIGLGQGSSLSSGASSTFNQYNQGSIYNREGAVHQQSSGFLVNHGQTQGVVGAVQGASYQTNIDYGQDAPAVVSTFSINSAQKSVPAVQPVVSVTPVVPVIQHNIAPQVASVTVPTAQQKINSAFVSSYNFQNQGYQFSKPAVSFHSQPTVQPKVVSSFNIHSAQKPVVQPIVSVTPVVPVIQHNVAPQIISVTPAAPTAQQNINSAVVSSYSFKNDGYQYTKPAISFHSQPTLQPVQPAVVSSFNIHSAQKSVVQPVVSVTPVDPIIEHNVAPQVISVTPAAPTAQQKINSAFVSSYNFQNQGYQFSKPAVSFHSQPTVQPVQPAVVSSSNIHSAQRPLVQPVVSVTPVVPIIEHNVAPQIVSVTPAAHKIDSAVVSSYNFQNEGYQYSKPTVSFHSQPAVQPAQPAVVSSFSIHHVQTPASIVQPVVPTVQQNIQPGIVSSYSFHNVAQNEGFQNSKAAFAFNTQPVVGVAQTVPVIQQTVRTVQPAVVSSFSFQNLTQNEGYHYNKHTLPVQQIVSVTPATTIIKQTLQQQPAILSNYNYQNAISNRGYQNIKQTVPVVSVTETIPVIQHRIKPAIVSSYSFQNEANTEGYKYLKQTVPLQPVQPIVSVTPTIPTVQKIVQPAVVTSYDFRSFANNGYKYNKQTVPLQPIASVAPIVPVIEDRVKVAQPAVVSSYSFQIANNDEHKYSKQTIPLQPIQPITNISPVVPIITHKNVQSVQPTITSSYSFQNLANNENYDYSKQISLQPVAPTIATIRKPVESPTLTTYSFNNAAKNDYSNYFASEVKSTIPTVVSSFNIQQSAQTDVFNGGYEYRKPAIAFEEGPLQATGSVVSVTPVVPVINRKIQPFTNIQQVHPTESAPVFSYSYKNVEATNNGAYNFRSEIKPAEGYSYSKPFVAFEEKPRKSFTVAFAEPTPQPILTVSTPVVPIIKQRVEAVVPVINSYVSQIPIKKEKVFINSGRFGEKISLSTTATPITIEDTIVSKEEFSITHPKSPKNLETYENRQPVQEVPFVAKKAYVTGQKQNQDGYHYSKPAIPFEDGAAGAISSVTSTAKYDEGSASVRSNSYRGKVSFKTPTYVEDYHYTTPRTNIYISTPAPFSRSRTNFNSQYSELYGSTPKPSYTSTIATVLAAKTPSPQFQFYDSRLASSTIPTFTSTENSQFGRKYSFNSVDDQYNARIATPQFTYLSTSTPKYVDESLVVSTPKQTYLPANTYGEYTVSSKQSASGSLLKSSVSKPKTYIRVNDFHPLLPAKLGAQCTCTSRTLKLNRKPTVVVPSAYDATSDDGYYVKPNINQNLNIPVENGGVVLENYAYEPKKVSGFSTTPSLVVKSTTNSILPAPAPAFTIRARVKVGQVSATPISSTIPFVQVTQIPEVFLKKTVTPAIRVLNEEESRPAQAQFVDVNQGLNLDKATVKGNAKEAISSRSFDRYGPGGWRSRQETLQGTIDCQRAGLFRHPEQCNKFYTCRWDCTKKRFTLHVFNCPVHLTFDSNLGACNWPSQGPACAGNTLLPNE